MSQALGRYSDFLKDPDEPELIYAGLIQIRAWHVDKTIVSVKCPGCLNSYELDHEVDVNGIVTPSLDCPGCDFHKMVYLQGWMQRSDVSA